MIATKTSIDNTRDRELVRRFKDGDESAFNEIVKLHTPRLMAVAKYQTRNEADAEEIVSKAFLCAYRKLNDFRGECQLSTWLCHITKNLSLNRYWYWKRRHLDSHTSFDAPISEDMPNVRVGDTIEAEDVSVTRAVEVNELMSAVKLAIAELPEIHRSMFAMRYVQGMAYDEIGEAVGINVGTVKSRIGRAREALRRTIDSRFPHVTAIATQHLQ